MYLDDARFDLFLAGSAAETRMAQALRYRVFVEELGVSGASVDTLAGLERDRFDDHADHLLLFDRGRGAEAGPVAVTRLLRADQAEAAGGFYTEGEFDLAPLRRSGRRLLELGRTCLDAGYRGGPAMLHLWQGVADYVADHGAEILFGTASFPGTDTAALAGPLSILHHRHRAPEALRPVAKPPGAAAMDLLPETAIDAAAAMRAMPALIKAYLRLGGQVGEGAFVDADFNCIDVCLLLDTATMSDRHRAIYARAKG
ncbi:GNAT family N-acetyltransferase [Rhodobacterales bacterium HKCCE2091]|nr:GNAT family N-acetyltransferase [Rhodobacterales bacterium HKCCE2091]